jgi:hypothetical protein
MPVKNPQIIDADSAVNGPLARELDEAYHALLGDADNCELFQRVDTLERAYRESLLPPWSIRWREIHSIPPGRGKAFRDLDRRSNVNALRRAVTAAKRTLQRTKGSPSQHVAAEVALQAAEDALAIYRQYPILLTPSDLRRVIGGV